MHEFNSKMGIIWSFLFAVVAASPKTWKPPLTAPNHLALNDVGKLAIRKESSIEAANSPELFQALLEELEVFCGNDRAHVVYQTALLYQTRFEMLGSLDDLEAGLKFMHASVSAQPGDPRCLQGLSMSYNARFQRLGGLEDLESALKYINAAIEMSPPDTPDSAVYQHSLALIHLQRFQRFDDVDALESAIRLLELAISPSSQSHPDYTALLMMLATAYGLRFMRFREKEDVASGIGCLRLVIAATPLGDNALPGRFLNLSKFYTSLSIDCSSLAALELAIKYGEAAVDSSRPGRLDIALFLSNLASSYQCRFQWLGDLQDLQFSIGYSLASIDASPEDYPDLPNFHLMASVGFSDLFERLKHEPFIRFAVLHAQRSIEITPKNHPSLASRKQHLAIAHLQCFRDLGQPIDLEEALDILQSVVDDVPENHPPSPDISYWIAECRKSRYEHLGDKHDLTLAIQSGLSSIRLLPPEDLRYPVYEQLTAKLFGDAFDVSMDVDDLNCALHYFRNAARRATTPHASWASAVHWAELCRKHCLPECLEAYKIAAVVLPDLVWMVNPITVWHEALVRLKVPMLTVTSAAASLGFHKPELAVEFLEQGLAITYKQLLQQREESTELAIQHPELAQKFIEHSFRMRQAASKHSALDAGLENKHTLALEHKKFVQEIRLLPGFETFFLPPRYHTLRAVAQNGPVIILNNTVWRSDAIIILAPQLPIQHIQLQASYEDLESQVQQLRAALGMCNIRSRQNPRRGQDQDEGTAQAMLQGIMTWSWDTLVSPIFQILHANGVHDGRLWWCPTGLFTQLPLHAAAPMDHNVYVQSYTPTLDVLLKATARYNAAKLQRQTDHKTTLTVVAVPELSPDHHLKDWENIPSALVEADHIKSIVGPDRIKMLSEKDATRAAVASSLTNPSWVHFACHGEQYAHEPLKSRLVLYDEELTLEEILRLHLRDPEFAFLSACETAMGDATLANESMHLAGGLMAAGFCGVIGTLWAIADDDSALVAKGVYRRLFKPTDTGPDVAQAAYALHAVIQTMRKRNLGFHRWMQLVHMGV